MNCSECWAIWDAHGTRDDSPLPSFSAPDTIEDLKDFRKLTPEGKRRLLLGESRFRIVGYDIEATNLKPNVGRILCCWFKPLGGEPYGFDALERRFFRPDVFDDGALAAAINDELEKFDIIVGWNSKGFDYKFINARAMRGGHRTKKAQPHIDGMWSWRSKFSAWSGLNNVQKFALPDAETEKTSVAWEEWMRALGWDKKLRESAMAEIQDHCRRDVIVLEDVYRAMVNADVFRSLRKDGGISVRAVRCEDSYHGCPECSHMGHRRAIPRCYVCGNANGLRVDNEKGIRRYVCMGPHVYEDSD